MGKQKVETLFDFTSFFAEVRESFQFLENEYGYQWLEAGIEDPDDVLDTHALTRYVSARMSVEVWWYFANALIGVSFFELRQSEESSFSVPRGANLYALAEMQDAQNDPHFLLKDIYNWRKHNKHEKLIKTSRKDIVIGLAMATQKYAHTILKGDTSIFPDALDFERTKRKEIY
jgi:hypothetical protein